MYVRDGVQVLKDKPLPGANSTTRMKDSITLNRIMFTFNRSYFIFAVLLFIVEVVIAMYVKDAVIRPYGGDFLVVILIYCAVKSFVNASVTTAAIGVLLFSYLVETLQHFHIVDLLGLQDNKIASIVIGTGFSWLDMLMYTLGVLTVWLIENKMHKWKIS